MVTVRRRETVRFGIAFVWALPVLFFGYFASQDPVYAVVAAAFAVLMVLLAEINAELEARRVPQGS